MWTIGRHYFAHPIICFYSYCLHEKIYCLIRTTIGSSPRLMLLVLFFLYFFTIIDVRRELRPNRLLNSYPSWKHASVFDDSNMSQSAWTSHRTKWLLSSDKYQSSTYRTGIDISVTIVNGIPITIIRCAVSYKSRVNICSIPSTSSRQ